MKKVIIIVKGGLVQDVYANTGDLDVLVIDYDNIEAGDEKTEEIIKVEENIKNKQYKQLY